MSHIMSHQWRVWLEKALPLWAGAGFSHSQKLFHERLSWDAKPVAVPEHRLMVQARQIATYFRAYLDGFFDAKEQAIECLAEVERCYWSVDGKPGWVFSLNDDKTVCNPVRDLYAHAFILFAYAWACKATGDESYVEKARRTLFEVDALFMDRASGGYWSSFPDESKQGEQNPHMHLLEACLALYDVTRDFVYFERSEHIISLALQSFIEPQNGYLLEHFDHSFNPLHPLGKNRVEPGHQFEWAWLLKEYVRLSEYYDSFEQHLEIVSENLFTQTLSYGCDSETLLVWDALVDTGESIEKTLRIWPQTELLRMMVRKSQYGSFIYEMDFITQHLQKKFLSSPIEGGWVDRLGMNGEPLVDYMPASSLYHLYGAARDIIFFEEKDVF